MRNMFSDTKNKPLVFLNVCRPHFPVSHKWAPSETLPRPQLEQRNGQEFSKTPIQVNKNSKWNDKLLFLRHDWRQIRRPPSLHSCRNVPSGHRSKIFVCASQYCNSGELPRQRRTIFQPFFINSATLVIFSEIPELFTDLKTLLLIIY